MIIKVQLATKKLLRPLRTGNFCLRRNGANTGSLATHSSITTKAKRDITESKSGQRTVGAPHCRNVAQCEATEEEWLSAHWLLVAVPRTEEYEKGKNLRTR